jgi:protein ImuA
MATARDTRALDDLRAQIARLEQAGRARQAALPFGVAAMDAHLPRGGLSLGALHEACAAGPEFAHGAATALFAAGVAARLDGPVLWCLPRRNLFAPALAGAGLHPDRLLYAEAGDEATVLAVAEEALRHPGLASVVAEVTRLGLTPSRRLQLAAEASGALGLVIRRWPRSGAPPAGSTAAATRWQVAALPSAPLGGTTPGVGRPRWRLELVRCRGGEVPRTWTVEACDGAGRLRLAADLADRSAAAAARRAAPRVGRGAG